MRTQQETKIFDFYQTSTGIAYYTNGNISPSLGVAAPNYWATLEFPVPVNAIVNNTNNALPALTQGADQNQRIGNRIAIVGIEWEIRVGQISLPTSLTIGGTPATMAPVRAREVQWSSKLSPLNPISLPSMVNIWPTTTFPLTGGPAFPRPTWFGPILNNCRLYKDRKYILGRSPGWYKNQDVNGVITGNMTGTALIEKRWSKRFAFRKPFVIEWSDPTDIFAGLSPPGPGFVRPKLIRNWTLFWESTQLNGVASTMGILDSSPGWAWTARARVYFKDA